MTGHPTHVTVLPFVPTPLDDEPLDAYLELVAHELSVPVRALHAHLGLNRTTGYGPAAGIDPTQERRLTQATGWSAERLHAMTMRRYEVAEILPPRGGIGAGPGPWLRRRGARYCPACLRERQLRWRLSWYIPWTFACVVHGQLLHNACPDCGARPRTTRRGHPLTGRSLVSETHSVEATCECPTSLLAEADVSGGPGHTVLDASVPEVVRWAQGQIDSRIENPDPVSYLGGIRSRTEWVHDLAALTRLLLVTLDHQRFPKTFVDTLKAKGINGGDDVQRRLESWEPFIGLTPYRSPAPRFSEALDSRVTFAAAAAVAVCVMTSSVRDAAEHLRFLLPSATRQAAVRSSRQRGTSWLLTSALMGADRRLTPGQVRSRRLAGELYRRDGSRRAPIPTSTIPARPWLGIRTAVPWIGVGPFAGLAATVTLLGVASTTHIGGICRELGSDHLAERVKYETAKLLRELVARDGEGVLDELLALHDAVAAMTVPIDYERRRRIFAGPKPLKRQTARKAARELGLRPTDRLARFMSWWVWEQLTGSDVLLTPRRLELPGPVRSAYHRQRTDWDVQQPRLLLRRAEHALMTNRIDEPISWSPVRTRDGGWDTSTPVPERQLDWSHRPGRRSSLGPTGTAEMRDADVVAMAYAGQTNATRQLALRLDRFFEFAQGPTIKLAANRLGIQQQVLSRNIARLEADLGRSLVERKHMSTTPSPAGVALCRAILRERRRQELRRRAAATAAATLSERR